MFRNPFQTYFRSLHGLDIFFINQSRKMQTYEAAVRALNGLQSNAATLQKTRRERDKHVHRKLADTVAIAARAQVTLEDIDKLSIIHVSGTKGKGSTCAFTESILRQCGFSTGFFSSPHLVEVRERIRIDGKPLSKDAFSSYFWQIYNKLESTKAEHGGEMPPYFKFLTIMAFHVFLCEKVDVAIMEVGIGGQYDCTNIARQPVVCGVTSLDIDHQSILGDTIDQIAWQKAGIFKPGAVAVTVPQPREAMDVIVNRAIERQCPVYLAPDFESYKGLEDVSLGIAGEKQKLNAALAMQLCKFWIQNHSLSAEARRQMYSQETQTNNHNVPQLAETFHPIPAFVRGLHECRWAGRNQVLKRAGVTYYIDGAHTTSSIQQCVDWFTDASSKEEQELGCDVARVLVFNVTGERSPITLLRYFLGLGLDAAVFCPNIASDATSRADQVNMTVTRLSQLRRCEDCLRAWEQLQLTQQNVQGSGHGGVHDSVHAHANGHASTQHAHTANTHTIQEQSQGNFPTALSAKSDSGDHNPSLGSHSNSSKDDGSVGYVFSCIVDALQWINQGKDETLASSCDVTCHPMPMQLSTADHVQVLVTGSLHLVGGVLGVLDPQLNSHHSSRASSRDASPDSSRDSY